MANTKTTFGVLIHGAGWVSTQHIAAFQNNPHTEIVAISSRKLTSAQKRADEAGLKHVGIYDDLEKALKHDGVDIVSVCTPQHLHAENVITAAASGNPWPVYAQACRVMSLQRMGRTDQAGAALTALRTVMENTSFDDAGLAQKLMRQAGAGSSGG